MRPALLPIQFWPVIALATTTGCGSAEPLVDGVAELVARTDKPGYSLAMDRTATPTLLNEGSIPVYAPMNEYVYVERWSESGWTDRRPWFAVDGSDVSFPVAPGDSLVALPMDFAYVSDRAGVYRFVFEVALDPYGRRLVPEDEGVTATFEVMP